VVNRTELGRVVGVGLALVAGVVLAQGAPAPTPGAPAPQGTGTSTSPGTGTSTSPGAGSPAAPPAAGGATDAPVQAAPDAAESTRPPEGAPAVGEGAPAGALTLEQLVARARAGDARVAEAEAELKRFQALEQQARWAWFPKFETTVGVGGPIPEARNDALGGPPTTEASLEGDLNFGKVGVTFFADVNAVLPLYTFGKLTALREAGERGPIVGGALRERARDEAGFQAAQAFYGYQLARSGLQQLEDVSNRLVEAAEKIDELLEQESAQVSRLDSYKVRFFQQIVEARRSEALQGQALALEAIRLLANARPGEALTVAEVDLPLEEELEPPSLERALASAAKCRPEFVAIRAGIEAREREVFIRERSYYPDLGLAGFATFRSTTSATPQLSPFAYDPYNDRSLGVGLVARATFDIPVKNAQLDEARAQLEKLQAQSRLLDAAIRLEVSKVHGELVAALGRARAFTEAEKSARRWATAAYAAFDLGTGDTRELVDAFTALAQSSAEASKSWHDVRVGLAGLARVTGTPAEGCE
jgi:outer membrane protein TolC